MDIDLVTRRVREEFREMPGLRLTRAQAQRLWGLDEPTCVHLLESLTEERFLYRTREGTYARFAESAGPFQQARMARVEPRTRAKAS